MYFSSLEDLQILSPDNSTDLVSLHYYVILPQINVQLEIFCQAYNWHKIRTEHNTSPLQVWVRGLLNGTSDQEATSGVFETMTEVKFK